MVIKGSFSCDLNLNIVLCVHTKELCLFCSTQKGCANFGGEFSFKIEDQGVWNMDPPEQRRDLAEQDHMQRDLTLRGPSIMKPFFIR